VEQDCLDRLARDEQNRDLLGEIVPLRAARERELPPLEHDYRQARESARHAEQQALSAQRVLDDVTERIRDSLLAAWDQARDAVRGHAQTVREGGGRFGQRRPALARSSGQLTAWADAWRPVVPDLPTTIDRLVDRVLWFEDRRGCGTPSTKPPEARPNTPTPTPGTAIDEADRAAHARRHAWRVYRDTDAHFEQALAHYGNLARTEQPAQLLAQLEIDAATGRRLDATQTTITALLAQPTLRALPAEQITAERDHWHIEHDVQGRERYARSAQPGPERASQHHRHVHRPPVAPSTPDHSPGMSR
jgi:exodeoxyribonuclease V alpha subunit